MKIQKVAVLGSGVMGSGIAAHIANAGVPVLLLDIVPKDATNRNQLAEGAIEKLKKVKPAAVSHPKKFKLITPGNLEDNLKDLAEVDWIIEAVLEKIEVKHDVYTKINAVRKKGSVVSSNTSTLPLHALIKGMPDDFVQDFMITHFFNPPRYMRLLEVVGSDKLRPDALAAISDFADRGLGKGVVVAKDTPGFIANRIGIYWMMVGLLEAMRLGISVEEADAVMGKPVGIPKTGIFGLFDLVGIDLMPHIGKAMMAMLPAEDSFHTMYKEPDLIKKMIGEGYTGRKGKGGFYRISADGKKTKEAINLQTGDYHKAAKPKLDSVDAAKAGLRTLLTHPDIGGQYAGSVMMETLRYAASLVPQISDDIVSIDQAMKTGFNWKYGPFELIDRLGNKKETGTAWFAEALTKEGKDIPAIIKAAAGRTLYSIENGRPHFMALDGTYQPIKRAEGVLLLSDVKLANGGKPITKNPSAALWDMGDGVLCLEYISKMNSIDPEILTMIVTAVETVQKRGGKGLVVGGDGENFSVGANLGFLLFAANMGAWPLISDVIKQGQQAMMAMKFAPFPVVAALHGMALGGGCETVLHADHVQAHLESYTGLVEVGVGLVPGWGGCKEMILRHVGAGKMGPMPGISKAFEMIATAQVSESAHLAQDMGILREADGVTMNRERLLADAKAAVLRLAENYTPPQPAVLRLPGGTAEAALNMAVDNFVASGKATPHDAVVARALSHVLSGGETDITEEITEQKLLDLEHEVFMQLVRHPGTLDRIEAMLNTGKPLRN